MSWFDRLLNRKSSSQDGVYERWLQLLGQTSQSKAGVEITRETAMRVAAAFACMRVKSEGLASMPLKLFRETKVDGKRNIQRATDHQLYDLVTTKPNGWQSAFDFLQQLQLHICLGNAYVFKGLYRGSVAEMFLLQPGRVRAVQHEDWSFTYTVTGKNGETRELPAANIWHVRGLSWDGFLGLDVLNIARDLLGLSVAVDDSLSGLHKNGVRPSGVYSVDSVLNEKQQKDLTAWIKQQAAAAEAGTPLVLDRGASWVSNTMTSVDAQLREIRQDIVPGVCQFFGVLPIMIGFAGDKAATYASAEAQLTAHKVYTLDPMARRIQMSADVNLLSDEERRAGLYHKFIAHALLNASATDQSEYFSRALGSGGAPAWMTQDEVRELLELNPMGGAASLLPVATNVPTPAPASPPAGA